MGKLLAKDLDKEKFDFEEEYFLKEKPYRLKDLPEDAVVKLKSNGEIDKRTFLPICPGYGVRGGRPKKVSLDKVELDLDNPNNLRNMFRACFDIKEVNELINKAKEVAIANGNQKMIQFLLEQLFGKAPQYVTHAGDSKNPLLSKEVDAMEDSEVDEYLSKVIEVNKKDGQKG